MGGVARVTRPFTDGVALASSLPSPTRRQAFVGVTRTDVSYGAGVVAAATKDRVLLRSYVGSVGASVKSESTAAKA